ncbi:TBP-related factor-like [Teleopsis dalmanni]|uniref:TBP-related factor-like n=1 Tax=Teleopsis dalmanni TaxID=139649 RepID=UPI0018CCD2C5|nr:TBP-related factor-like [Teleopsis dalmanni]XP_037960494.1 TBP-related factor-like [Teleopsis dalmanni]XP_037961147.1 TBP-related factor-like [Teleopsis dalmanni]
MADEIFEKMEIKNVVATYNVGIKLDLLDIYRRTRNSEYSPQTFIGMKMTMRFPKCTARIFNSGKVVVVGTKSEVDARLGSHKFAKLIQKLGYEVEFKDFTICNIVGVIDVRFPIGLEDLNNGHMQFTKYEPEIFPALYYRLPTMLFLIYASGKLVVTGAKSVAAIKEGFAIIYAALAPFKRD